MAEKPVSMLILMRRRMRIRRMMKFVEMLQVDEPYPLGAALQDLEMWPD